MDIAILLKTYGLTGGAFAIFVFGMWRYFNSQLSIQKANSESQLKSNESIIHSNEKFMEELKDTRRQRSEDNNLWRGEVHDNTNSIDKLVEVIGEQIYGQERVQAEVEKQQIQGVSKVLKGFKNESKPIKEGVEHLGLTLAKMFSTWQKDVQGLTKNEKETGQLVKQNNQLLVNLVNRSEVMIELLKDGKT